MIMPTRIYSLNPTITPTVAYATGQQLGPTSVKIPSAVLQNGQALFNSLIIVDGGKQSAAIDLLFWSGNPTGITSADQGAFSAPAAEMAAKFMGAYSVLNTDYKSTALASVASLRNLNQLLFAASSNSNQSGRDLYLSLVVRGAPTYLTSKDLTLILGLLV